MQLPPIISCFIKIQSGLPFSYSHTYVILEKWLLNMWLFCNAFMLQDKPGIGQGNIPEGALTTDFYRCKEMPERFNHPG